MNCHFFSCFDDFKKFILDKLLVAYHEAINEGSLFNIVLPGGITPIPLFKELRKLNFDWSKWRIWMADERCSDNAYDLLNSTMLFNELIDHLPFNKENIILMDGLIGPMEGAKSYQKKLHRAPTFNFVLLGIGEDGHVASLFPGNDWGMDEDASDAIPVYNSPKYPQERISLSGKRLCRVKHIVFMATGEKKKEVIRQICFDDCKTSPVSVIRGELSNSVVYCTFQQNTEI
jgi:6-phosphogluconolactonase